MEPREELPKQVWNDVDEAVVLPAWHCGFRGCKATSASSPSKTMNNHEFGLWHHIWHTTAHKQVLEDILAKYTLKEDFCNAEETAFTLVNQAYMKKERKSCPRVGIATDRRSLSHLGEVFFEENVQVLMCFICGCKHVHQRLRQIWPSTPDGHHFLPKGVGFCPATCLVRRFTQRIMGIQFLSETFHG